MHRISLIFIAFILIFATPLSSFAWGKKGHNLVADVAARYMDDATRKKVQHYLGSTTFDEASTWMDEMRSDHSYDYMKPWHYVDFPKGKLYNANTEENLVNELNKVIGELNNKSKLSDEQIKTDILILFHLVGDLHQPLHVGYADDKGGNAIKLTFIDKADNLHWVWDNGIIENKKVILSDVVREEANYTPAQLEQLKKINIENWVNAERPLLTAVYDFNNNTIDQAYVDRNIKTVETQLFIAGIRLAAILEQAFK
ncbi:MAG: S1/P1 nuclease [Bacteroidota bacterium]